MRKINGAWHVIVVLYSLGFGLMVQAQSTSFHSAPTSAKDLTPPSIADSGKAGKQLYERHCASCHGDLEARGPSEHILDLPKGGHTSRDIQVEPNGQKILISVRSFSNADDADNPLEKNRANILEVNPERRRFFRTNPGGHPGGF
jgi:hypothetical protein